MKVFEFDAETRQHTGLEGSFTELQGQLAGDDNERLEEMYTARREYSPRQIANATRPLKRWNALEATPLRKAGESREEWLTVIEQYGHVRA